MTVVLGSDHAGFSLKESVKSFLQDRDADVIDCGAHEYSEGDDYPDFIIPAAEEVVDRDCKGIVFGGSGQGEAIAANKVEGVRAAVFYGGDDAIIRLSREHNDANVLSLGARFLDVERACDAVAMWLETSFSGDERHQRRIDELARYESYR